MRSQGEHTGADRPRTTRLALTGVTVGYGSTARLHDVTVTLGAGLHILIGANGSGKTTLLRVAAGVLLPWEGTVDRSNAGCVGYVAHRPALSPRLTVEDNLRYWARMRRVRDNARVSAALARVGLTSIRGRAASTLSRGQAQRLAIARALLPDPHTVLLDEPMAGVDPSGAQTLLELVTDLAEEDRCVVVSSHALTDLAGLPADVLALRDGRVVAHGTPGRLRDTLTAPGYRVRLRGSLAIRPVLTGLGVAWEPGSESDATVYVRLGSETDVPGLVTQLVKRGVAISEVSPVVDDLTQIYLSLEQGR